MKKIDKNKLYQVVNQKGQKIEPTFTRYFDQKHPRHDRYKERFAHMLEYIVGPKILDVGCGTGLTCYLTSQLDNIEEIHGLDLQLTALEVAKKNVSSKKVTFHHGFAEELKFDDNYFNTIFLTETLEHVADVEKVLKQCYRVLKKNFPIIISCPNNGDTSSIHVRSISRESLEPLIEKFFKIKTFEIIKYPGPGPSGIFCVGVKK